MTTRPRVLIEQWLPVKALGIESQRERAVSMDLPPLFGLHVWWARRPIVASSAAVLASLLPRWTVDLPSKFAGHRDLASPEAYQSWFKRLCGILGDPEAAKQAIDGANARGERLKGNGYGYPQAFKNRVMTDDLRLLHELLEDTWHEQPSVLDPTAGGGSIPFAASRYGLQTSAVDINGVAASLLRAGVSVPAKYGEALFRDLETWGRVLVERVEAKLSDFFPKSEPGERIVAYLHARTVACPRTGKTVPFAHNWWLAKGESPVAVRMLTERGDRVLDEPEFEIARGSQIDFDPDAGTVARGTGISPWDGLAIQGEYIKSEAQRGRMGSVLYAVATRGDDGRSYRAPTSLDLHALASARATVQASLSDWEAAGLVPNEEIDQISNYNGNHRVYGINLWRDMFSDRQLLAHVTFVECFQALVPEVRQAVGDDGRADAILALIATMQGKALNFNGNASSWMIGRSQIRAVFERHGFSFKWTFAEFDAGGELFTWALERGVLRAYAGLSRLLRPSDAGALQVARTKWPTPSVAFTDRSNASLLESFADRSQAAVCIDPPYYDNVMYAELSDFFYVWEKRTLGLVWPEFFELQTTDKKNEAVANPARFRHAGKRKAELAAADYEAKMTAIFEEAHRVLRDDGVLTVMFTHKKAEAWDTLGLALMDAGFTIETSWPVPTESENSLHQAKMNAAQSTIFLVCRKREERDGVTTFYEDIEADVRAAARDALERFRGFGIDGVDLLLSTYGPALSVISSHWPVLSSEADPMTGRNRPLRPEEALDTAREEVVRLQRQRLIGRAAQLDALTDFTLLAWQTFQAREFPFDEARRLALAVGGLDVDTLARAKLLTKKSGTVVLLEPSQRVRRKSDAEAQLPGVRLDATAFEYMVDAVHTALHIAKQDGPAVARQFLEKLGLTRDARFLAAFQGFVNAIPRTRSKGKWVVPEAGLLDDLAVFLDGVTTPAIQDFAESPQQGSLAFDEDDED